MGARSALFAPLENLGVIVIDEEHDSAYKNDEGFRYHACELATRRAAQAGCPLVLGTATPSLETRFLADRGGIQRLVLPSRIGGRPLPAVEIVDLQRERDLAPRGRRIVLSSVLERAMAETLEQGGQTVLLLNRRGFSTQVMCFACGHAERCVDCDIALVYHATDEQLRCHYCDHRAAPPERCSNCGAPDSALLGLGTQRLEEEVRTRFPEARIVRLDRDTALKSLNNLRTWTNPTGSPGPEHHKTNVTAALALYQNGDLVCSKSADGQYILGLARTDPEAALGALAFLASQKWGLHDQVWRDVLRGATHLTLSRIDGADAVRREAEALEALRMEWGERLVQQKASGEAAEIELRTELETTRKAITKAQERVSKFWIDQGYSVRDFYRKARSDKDNLEKAFIEHMRLKAPANYWREKALAHLIWAVGSFISFAAVSALAALMLIDNASSILGLVQPANDGGFPWGNVVIITLPALAFFWFLRFVARVFVTNLQRHQDARERPM